MITIDYIIVFVFLVGMFYVGSIFYKWVGSSDDFYLAGRQLTPFILAAVLAATKKVSRLYGKPGRGIWQW